ncbi:phage holin family protein [Peptoniphilus sp.]|jgi:putative membrane protein|uniref:phage holin family protein n=1 Tax=Peptoniphilus sp. TaxID=1971214 RepID=UPI003D932C47
MILSLIIKVVISALAILLTSALSIGVTINGFGTAIVTAIVIGLLDWLIEKFTGVDASPAGRGFKGFAVAAIILFLAGKMVDGFTVSVLGAIIGAAVLGIVDAIIPGKRM